MLTDERWCARQHKFSVVWKPLPGSQTLALDTRAHHTLYCGSRGPGKTECQLMRFRRFVGKGYGQYWRGIIFDREYKNLDDIVAKSKKLFNSFNDGARFLASKGEYKWVWPSGEELLLRVVKKDTDYDDYHGHEYPFIGWNELTKHPTKVLYEKMMSCNRSSFVAAEHSPVDRNGKMHLLQPIPLQVFSTTNSNGPGHHWVKKKFITVAPYGAIVRETTRVFDPQSQTEIDVVKTQVAIFGSYRENRYLTAEYIAELHKQSDENLRAAWLYGSWDIVSGGAIGDVWKREKHVIPRFAIPSGWYIDRAFDWGSTHPYSVGWFAEANGEEARFTGRDGKEYTFCPPRGSLIRIHELYGAVSVGDNKGLRESPKTIAEKVKIVEQALLDAGWIKDRPTPGPADNQIHNNMSSDEDSIAKKMQDNGVRWERSDKSPGSRVNGLDVFRGMLEAATKNETTPHFYVMEHCSAWQEIVPSLPRDDIKVDDIDTTAEDHIWDETRYRVLKGSNRLATSLDVTYAQ